MKRVTARHGVGRKPEDGKRLHIIELRLLSPVSRVPYFLLPNEGLTPLAMDMSPTYVGYKFRSLALAYGSPNPNLLIRFEFLEVPITPIAGLTSLPDFIILCFQSNFQFVFRLHHG